MNYLPQTSKVRNRYNKIQNGISAYWIDKMAERLQRRYESKTTIAGMVIAVLRHPELELEILIPGMNIVTDDGDLYYAQSAVAETPTDDFDDAGAGFILGTDNTAPTKSDTDVTAEDAAGRKATDGTYPQTDDQDGDNGGAGTDIVTWRVSYTIAEAIITGIWEGAIVDVRATPTAALTHFLFAAQFNKTASDTLKVFVNHEMLGV
jgi:hypothetical protein